MLCFSLRDKAFLQRQVSVKDAWNVTWLNPLPPPDRNEELLFKEETLDFFPDLLMGTDLPWFSRRVC